MKRILTSMLLLCSPVITAIAQQQPGKGLTVTLDYYYNNEFKPGKNGIPVRWHYIWTETDTGGLSIWGGIFDSLGVRRDSLLEAPTAANLAKTDIYMIIDPDTEKESSHPNYMNEKDAAAIVKWVKAGGVLVLMENDSANAEFEHFNKLSEKFGIHFNGDSRNRVKGKNWEQGTFQLPVGHDIFTHGEKVYIKELSTIQVKPPASAVFKDGEHVIMAVAKVGKGKVFAVGDPWFYNEYVDGKRLPASYQNVEAAADLTQWLISAVSH